MSKNIKKLLKLTEHWAEHNDSHRESFEKWKKIANEEGLGEVVEHLDKAIEMIEKSSEYLRKAHSALED
jgi:septation ring formation regulator EzrA